VFSAFADHFGLDKDTALKLAGGFGAGMGRKQEVCGAVSGGVLVLGARYGMGEKAVATGDMTAKETTYAKTRELIDRFVARHGTVICRKLIDGCDLMTEEGRRQFKERDLVTTKCRPCVESVVEILEAMLQF